ncbi:MAG: hypothetical protein KC502_08005, partial [Myxococcales bacterium]|nr:hypothetical protein [Myxococcales bacterium]
MTSKLDDLEDAGRRGKGAREVLSHRLSQVSKTSKSDHVKLERVDGRVSQLIADLRDRAGITILALPRELPDHANDWVKLAENRFGWGEVRVAEAIAKECRKRFQGTKQAGRCGLIQARIAYEEHRFGDAVLTYRAVHDGLDGKPVLEVAAALLGIATTFEAQGKCKQARDVLGYVSTLMKRKGKAARAAKELLKTQPRRCSAGKVVLPPRTSGQLKLAAEAKKKAEAEALAKAEAERRAAAEAKRKAEEAAIQKARSERDAKAKADEAAAAEKAAAEKAAAAKKAAAEKAAAEKAAAEKAAAEKAAVTKSAGKTEKARPAATSGKSGSPAKVSDKTTTKKAVRPATPKSKSGKAAAPAEKAAKKTARTKPTTATKTKAVNTKSTAKKPTAKKPATKKPATKKPATKKPATKKPATKKPGPKAKPSSKPAKPVKK